MEYLSPSKAESGSGGSLFLSMFKLVTPNLVNLGFDGFGGQQFDDFTEYRRLGSVVVVVLQKLLLAGVG